MSGVWCHILQRICQDAACDHPDDCANDPLRMTPEQRAECERETLRIHAEFDKREIARRLARSGG